MPSFNVGPVQGARAIDIWLARETREQRQGAVQEERGTSAPLVKSGVLDAGAAPVDTDRVSEIRKAIEQGTYPVIPARIADAIIAAGYLLRSGK